MNGKPVPSHVFPCFHLVLAVSARARDRQAIVAITIFTVLKHRLHLLPLLLRFSLCSLTVVLVSPPVTSMVFFQERILRHVL